MTRIQQGYLHVFAVATIVCLAPNKMIPYVLPFFGIVWITVIASRKLGMLFVTLVAAGLMLTFAVIHALLDPNFVFITAFLTAITYASFYLPLLVPSRLLAGPVLFRRAFRILFFVVVIESLLGMLQVGYLIASGRYFLPAGADLVAGTIRPVPIGSGGGFDNAMYTINLSFALLALPVYSIISGRKRRGWFLFGLLILMLAKVVHVGVLLILAWSFAIVICYFGFPRIKKVGLWFGLLVLGLLLFIPIFQPAQVWRASSYLTGISESANPKLILAQRLLTEVPEDYAYFPFVGLGAGQLSSRANLLVSGEYLGANSGSGRGLPFISPRTTKPYRLYIMDLWEWVVSRPYTTSTVLRPFSSWLSFYGEFGVLISLLLIGAIAQIIWRIKRKAANSTQRFMGFIFITGMLFLFLLGSIENYWELPQAIFIGCLMLKILHANIKYNGLTQRVATQLQTAHTPDIALPPILQDGKPAAHGIS